MARRRALGYEIEDMLDTVRRLALRDFWKTERSLEMPAELMDVYTVRGGSLLLHIKLTRDVLGFYKLVSFHEA